MVLILLVTNIGGVSGGGQQVPICLIFFKFDIRNAVAISNISIFLSGFMRWLINSQKSHPLKNGRGILVDMNLCMIMLPPIVSGASFGVFMNLILPKLVIVAAYVAALTYFGIRIFKKSIDLYHKEVDQDKKIADKLNKEAYDLD